LRFGDDGTDADADELNMTPTDIDRIDHDAAVLNTKAVGR